MYMSFSVCVDVKQLWWVLGGGILMQLADKVV